MRHYKVKLCPKALWQLNDIYKYVSDRKRKLIKKAILDLDTMPRCGTIRQQGVYATGEYRQSIVEEFIVIYRICEELGTVDIITIKNEKLFV